MKISNLFTAIFSAFVLVACGGNSDSEPPTPPTPPAPKIPDWIKENTAHISFISRFSDEGIAQKEALFGKISEYLSKRNDQLILIDFCQVDTQSDWNGTAQIANALKGFAHFGFNKYNGNIAEGTSIITQRRRGAFLDKDGNTNPNTDITTIARDVLTSHRITDDCYLSESKTLVRNGVVFPYGTVRLENENHLNQSKKQMELLMRSGCVIIGTMPANVAENITTWIAPLKATYNYDLEIIRKNANRSLFVVKPRSWVLREKSVVPIESGLDAVHLQLETNVFY